MTENVSADSSRQPFRWVILAGVWLTYFCFGLTTVTLAPLVNVVGQDLGLGHAQMGVVLGGWQLIYIATAIPSGLVLDRIGPRRAIVLATLIIALSGGLRAAAEGYLSLFLAVAVFGFGGPMISIGSPKLISLWFEGKERGFAMGIYITGPVLGSVAGLSLTNSVLMPALDGSWRSVMLVYAAVVVAAAAAWWLLTAHPSAQAMERRIATAKHEPQLRAFASLLRVPSVQVLLAMAIGIFFFNHGLNSWLPEILRSHGLTAAEAGYWASLPALVGVAASLTIPRMATPQRRLAILGVLITAGGFATLLLHGVDGFPLVAGLITQGIARGGLMTVAVLTLIEVREVGPSRAGLAGGMFFAAAEIGGVLGPVSIGVISEATHGFTVALWTVTVVCAVLLALLAVLRRLMTRGVAADA